MRIISIINNKGGVGKTTTTQNLAGFLARKGYLVGLIDFDGQGNLTDSFKIEDAKVDLLQALTRDQKLSNQDFSDTQLENVKILYNVKNINSGTFGVIPEVKRLGALKRIIGNLSFDFVLIDTAPSFDINTLCPLYASNDVLVPINFERYSVSGLSNLFETIELLNTEHNAKINILGVFATKVDERLAITGAYRPMLEESIAGNYLQSFIRTNSKYQQAQDSSMDIFELDDFKGSEDYSKLGDEVLTKLNLNSN